MAITEFAKRLNETSKRLVNDYPQYGGFPSLDAGVRLEMCNFNSIFDILNGKLSRRLLLLRGTLTPIRFYTLLLSS